MRRTSLLVPAALLVLALLPAACSKDGRPAGGSSERTPVVVDTDMGQDDMMALLFLLRRPDVRVEAITVSGTGLAHCGPGVAIAQSLLDVADAPPDVAVSCGPREPLPGTYPYPGAFPTSWRAATDGAYGLDLPVSERTPSSTPAPELLVSTIRGAGAPVELVTLGPLTNVALALRRDPALVDDLAGITIMGGAIDVPGNAIRTPVAEWNVWVDPVAAEEVLSSGADVTLVPLDATNGAPVTPFFADALAAHHPSAAAATVEALFEAQPYLVSGQYFFWDPLAAAIAVDGSLASYVDHLLTVLEGEKEIQGRVVDDPDGAMVRVARTPDAPAFEREFLNTLNADEAVTSTRPDALAAIAIDDEGCTYGGRTDPPAGDIPVEIRNTASTAWNVVALSIALGHTYAEVEDVVTTFDPSERPPPWVKVVEQTSAIPGETVLVPWRLGPGHYAVVCQRDQPFALRAVTGLVVS